MEDTDCDQAFLCFEEDGTDDTVESVNRLSVAVKPPRKKRLSELRQPRQRFCPRWETDFPWLRADKVDESVGYCTVCSKHLVCKKSHLERHQKSYKHQRLSSYESFEAEVIKPQPEQTEFLECGKRDLIDEDGFEDAIELDTDFADNVIIPVEKIKQESDAKAATKVENSVQNKHDSKQPAKTNKCKIDRLKLLKCIDRDRNELNDYYYSRQKQTASIIQCQTRDNFDLFFDSVSASVKLLPPKLAAEVKSRVSQLLADYELRAICEREAFENSSIEEGAMITTRAAPVEEVITEITQDEELSHSDVPHIVYTFQPK